MIKKYHEHDKLPRTLQNKQARCLNEMVIVPTDAPQWTPSKVKVVNHPTNELILYMKLQPSTHPL